MLFQRFFIFAFFYSVFFHKYVKAPSTSLAIGGKIEPIRLFAANRLVDQPKVDVQSDSVSSISSFSTLQSETSFIQPNPFQNPNPIASTSAAFDGIELRPLSTGAHRPIAEIERQSDLRLLFESERQPMIERTENVRFMESVDLGEASQATHTNGNINPTRDGVFARVRSAVLRYGAAAAVGSAIGVGIAEIAEHVNHVNEKKIIVEVTTTTTNSEETEI